ncbi:TIGR02680 family protein [Enterococcus sp. LJL98]
MNNKWVLNRAGFHNFWKYAGSFFFDFADGKLFLRGSNGRGKSVAMVSLLPPLLDGRVDARRMDPFFQSTDRKMGDILLGEKEILGIDNRIGYITLEYKRLNTDGIEEYFTSGIGMKADRNNTNGNSSKLTRWYFAINGAPRVTSPALEGFHLITDNGDDTYSSLTKQVLKNKIAGIGARFFDNPSSYGEYINRKIFKFTKMEDFNEMIKLLIKLRASKLGDKSGPNAVTDILLNSMSELPEGELDVLKNVIEDMERIQEDQINLARELKSLAKVNIKYREYLEERLGQLVTMWLRNKQEYESFIHSMNKRQQDIIRLDEENHNLVEKQNQLERNLSLLREEYERTAISNHSELIRMVADIEKELEKLNLEAIRKKIQFKRNEKQFENSLQRLEQTKKSLEEQRKQQEQNFMELTDNASGFNYVKQHQNFFENLSSGEEKYVADLTRKKKVILELENNLSLVEGLASSINLAKERVKQCEKEHSHAIEALDLAKSKAIESEGNLEEGKEKLQEEVIEWSELALFEVPSDSLNLSLYRIRKLYDGEVEFSDVKAPIEQAKRVAINAVESQILPLKNDLNIIKESLSLKIKERELLREGKFVEPERTKLRRKAREMLMQSGVIFNSFYETIDFQGGLEEELKNRIESALRASGLLDAVISADEKALRENDLSIIAPAFTFGEGSNTLARYLKVEAHLSVEIKEMVTNILNSIQINEGGEPSLPIIHPDGTYQLSILKGKSNSHYQASFIGKTSRESERKRKIEVLQNEIFGLREDQKIINQKITTLERRIEAYEADFSSYPNEQKIRELLRIYKSTSDKVLLQSEAERMKLDEKEQAATELQKYRKKLFDLKAILKIEINEEKIAEIKQYAHNYYIILGDVIQTVSQIKQFEIRVEEQKIDNDYQNEICVETQEELESIKEQIIDKSITSDKIKQQREFKEAEKIIVRQSELKKEMNQAEEERKVNDQLLGKLEVELRNSRKELEYLLNQKEKKRLLKENWLKLCYSAIQKYSQNSEVELDDFAKQFERRVDREKMTKVTDALIKVIRDNRDQLLVYNLESEPRNIITRRKVEDESIEMLYESWDDYNNFEILEVDTQNMRNSSFLLETILREEKAENDRAYQKDQEEMYRQVLFGKLGKTTRELVVEGRTWAIKMDQMLKRIYGGEDDLQLELKLVPKPSQSEGVTSTSQLIDIWSSAEEGILTEENRKKVISFFKKGLDDAILIVKENPGTTDLKEELKKVFDYRQWFFFRLKYKKNAKQKEFERLTQGDFMKMSGGERAKSLYLPLFIAMRLRFESASEFAPYIITLDEAFTGVDDEGRESMMGVAEELGFNYIMNSQEMWPEYSTVSSINTYEFKQDKSAPYVETIKYSWNGNVRSRTVGDIIG